VKDENVKAKNFHSSPMSKISPKQGEAAFVFLKTIKDFQFSSSLGIAYTEIAKHLWIAKQLSFEVRVRFDYPAKHPTCPSRELKIMTHSFETKRLIKKTSTAYGAFFKITPEGQKLLEKLEESLRSLPDGFDKVTSLEELHRKEELKEFKTRRLSKTPIEELQRKVVRPLTLELIEESSLIFTDPSLKSLERSEVIAPTLEKLDEEDVNYLSEIAIKSFQKTPIDENSEVEPDIKFGMKGEVAHFVKALMYGLAKYRNKGFLAATGELMLVHAVLKHSGKNDAGQIYTVGTRYRRKITVRTSAPLDIACDQNRETFVLAYIEPNKTTVLALVVPKRFQ
jgi:hypothetical protein